MDSNKIKKIAFCIADDNNLKYAEMMEKSLRKFHSKEELPLLVVSGADLQKRLVNNPMFYYRATPIIASELTSDNDVIIKIDADSIITGDISDAWKEKSDVSVVLNSNPKEYLAYPYTIWDIAPFEYFNCGFVVMKNKRFVDYWKLLCFSSHFNNYQMREQDLLNIMCHYGDYRIEILDAGDSLWGLSSKGYWQYIEVDNNKLVLNPIEGYPPVQKTIKVIHWGGGNTDPQKMNYRIRFSEPVCKYLDKLIK